MLADARPPDALDAALARYLAVPAVGAWLSDPSPVREVSAAALRNAFVYAIAFGDAAVAAAAHPGAAAMDVEDMLIVCGVTPENFALGVVFGLAQPHVFARTPLMAAARPRTRRFAVDLNATAALEFMELVHFENGMVCCNYREFLHAADGALPVVVRASLHAPPAAPLHPATAGDPAADRAADPAARPPPSSPPPPPHGLGPVVMRARIVEAARCPLCSSPCALGARCPCGFEARARARVERVATRSWPHFTSKFMRKARDGRISLSMFAVVPHVGEVPMVNADLAARNVLVQGDSPYMTLMRRKAVHGLGIVVSTPAVDAPLEAPAEASDFLALHNAHVSSRHVSVGDAVANVLHARSHQMRGRVHTKRRPRSPTLPPVLEDFANAQGRAYTDGQLAGNVDSWDDAEEEPLRSRTRRLASDGSALPNATIAPHIGTVFTFDDVFGGMPHADAVPPPVVADELDRLVSCTATVASSSVTTALTVPEPVSRENFRDQVVSRGVDDLAYPGCETSVPGGAIAPPMSLHSLGPGEPLLASAGFERSPAENLDEQPERVPIVEQDAQTPKDSWSADLDELLVSTGAVTTTTLSPGFATHDTHHPSTLLPDVDQSHPSGLVAEHARGIRDYSRHAVTANNRGQNPSGKQNLASDVSGTASVSAELDELIHSVLGSDANVSQVGSASSDVCINPDRSSSGHVLENAEDGRSASSHLECPIQGSQPAAHGRAYADSGNALHQNGTSSSPCGPRPGSHSVGALPSVGAAASGFASHFRGMDTVPPPHATHAHAHPPHLKSNSGPPADALVHLGLTYQSVSATKHSMDMLRTDASRGPERDSNLYSNTSNPSQPLPVSSSGNESVRKTAVRHSRSVVKNIDSKAPPKSSVARAVPVTSHLQSNNSRDSPLAAAENASDEKKHACSICPSRFKMRGDLQRHIKVVHQGKKCYVCETCGKAFGHSGHLNRHRQSHRGERRFECKLCGYKFFQMSHLMSHVEHIHSSSKGREHECSLCRLRVANVSELRAHLRGVHKLDGIRDPSVGSSDPEPVK